LVRHTASFAAVQTYKETDCASQQQAQSQEIKIAHVFLKRPPFVGIQVEEEEQNDTSNTSGGSIEPLGHAV
jgi:hypothetical protein